jgi:hypothetical protein
MDPTNSIREELPDPNNIIIDAEIWMHDSHELNDLARTIVNRHARFAWMVVDARLTEHDQILIDKK